VLAFWFPLTIAAITTLTWLFWLVFGVIMFGRSMAVEPD
jgi:hypothetical protein